MVWSLVLIKVYFTDLSEYKIRPVYIFKKYDNEDFMFLPLSSNLSKNWVFIKENDLSDWELDKDSIIIIAKIWIIHKSLILKDIWKLKSEKIKEIHKKLCNDLWC